MLSIAFSNIYVSVKSKYVNLNDIENPINTYAEEIDTYSLHYQSLLQATLTIEPQEVVLEDSFYFSFISPSPKKFNKLWDREKVLKSYDNVFGSNLVYKSPFRLIIELSSNTYQYKRKVLNFLEVTGILGGLFELFEVVFGIIIGIVSSYSLRGQLIEEIKVNKKKNRELEKELNSLRDKRLNTKNHNRNEIQENRKEEEKFINWRLSIQYIVQIYKKLL